MMRSLLKKIKGSDFFKVFRLIKKNKKMCSLLVGLDILFFAMVYGVNLSILRIGERAASMGQLFFMMALNVVLIILFYSLFKHAVMKIINSFIEKTNLDFKKFWKFLSLNVMISAVLLVIFLIVEPSVNNLFKPEYATNVFNGVIVVLFVLFYLFINTLHFTFLKEMKVFKSVKKSYAMRKRNYLGILSGSFVFFVAFYLLYVITALVAGAIAPSGEYAQVGFAHAYGLFLNVLMMLFVYFLMFFNRIYFRLVVEKR